MEMHMEDLLLGCFSVRQEEIHPFTGETAGAERPSHSLGHAEYLRSCLRWQVGQVSGMVIRHDEHMTCIHWLHIHEGGTDLIPMDDASLQLPCEDATEDAVHV